MNNPESAPVVFQEKPSVDRNESKRLPGESLKTLNLRSGGSAGALNPSGTTDFPALYRRPLRSRETGWARGLARFLGRTPLSPNAISVLGILFSGIGFACLALTASRTASPVLFLIAAGMIQLRLLCNLMDGLVAVEGRRGSPTGDLFNEAPDRLEDVLFLVGAGIAASFHPWGLTLGWLAALAALATAYIRVLGASLGTGPDFSGPLAKPQRMFFLTIGCLGASLEAVLQVSGRVLPFVLALIAAGALLTSVRRLALLHANLKGEAGL